MTIAATTASNLDHVLATLQRDRRLPSITAGIVRGGQTLWTGTIGTLDGRPDGERPSTTTQYRIGSITKTFVAVLVMRLREQGRLRLDDRLGDHLDHADLDPDVARVSIEQLLTHGARVQAETDGPWWERTPGIDFDTLAGQVRLRPGALGHHYSNVGFALLGRVIEVLHGRRWFDVLTDEILTPLGMTATTMRPTGAAAPGWAVHPFADVLMAEPEHDAGAMSPAGQLWSTVDDLLKWADFLARGDERLLPDATLELMLQPRVLAAPAGAPWTHTWGLGFSLHQHQLDGGGLRLLPGHGGSMPGFQAGLLADRSTGTGAVSYTNSTDGTAGTRDLINAFLDAEPAPVRPWHAAGDPTLLDLLGTWYWGPARVTVTADGEGLLRIEGGRSSRFRPVSPDEFVGLDGYYAGEPLRVVRGADGTPAHLDLASFRFSRTPYSPEADIPGGLLGDWA